MPATKGDLIREFQNAKRSGRAVQVTFHDVPKADRRPNLGIDVLLRLQWSRKITLTPEDELCLKAIDHSWEMPSETLKATFTVSSRLGHQDIEMIAAELSKSFRHVSPAPLEALVPS